MKKKIVFVGGGSYGWSPRIVKDMVLTEELSNSTFVLYDIDKSAADLVAKFLRKLNDTAKTGATFVPTDNRTEAFADADYFVITISTGGLDAMAHDLAIPEDYGIYHTVGDTSGPGGWARLIRNFEVFVELAKDFNSYAAGAPVLNYTNPMSTLTDVLARLCTAPVIGLCHGLFENLDYLARIYGIENEDKIAVKYAGLNHFFWTTEARIAESDILADLRERVASEGMTSILEKTFTGTDRELPVRDLSTALFNETGVMPYFGDRHTCEFFPCYITDKGAMEQYRLVRTSIEERREKLADRKASLESMVRAEIPKDYFEKSRETAADIIAAHATGSTFIDVGNLPNIGQVSNLPAGVVLETATRIDANGFSPIAFGALPQPVLGYIEPYARVFTLLVDACFERNREKALQALRLDPVCSHLTGDRVREMGERLLTAHSGFGIPF